MLPNNNKQKTKATISTTYVTFVLYLVFAYENKDKYCDAIELTQEILISQISSTPIMKQNSSAKLPFFSQGEKMDEYLGKIDTLLLKQAMESNNNNQTHAAKELGISRGGLIKKLKRISH